MFFILTYHASQVGRLLPYECTHAYTWNFELVSLCTWAFTLLVALTLLFDHNLLQHRPTQIKKMTGTSFYIITDSSCSDFVLVRLCLFDRNGMWNIFNLRSKTTLFLFLFFFGGVGGVKKTRGEEDRTKPMERATKLWI